MEKVSIIIPAYNEEKRIKLTLEKYYEFFRDLKKKNLLDFEINIVINGTTDNTPKIVEDFCKGKEEMKYMILKRGGKGLAITAGFKDSITINNNFIGFVDADMATKPEAYYYLIKNIRDLDGTIASRYIRGAEINPKPTLKRKIASRMFNFLIRSIINLPHKDTQCGAKVFRRKVIENILPNLKFSKWAYDVELLYNCKRFRFKIKEIPTVWSDKEYSKINFMTAGPMMVLGVIRLRIINSPLKRTIRIYDFFANITFKLMEGTK